LGRHSSLLWYDWGVGFDSVYRLLGWLSLNDCEVEK